MRSVLEGTLEKAAAGARLTYEEGAALLSSHDLLALGQAARRRCEALHPQGLVTFTIDRNINNTNVCITGCRFCAFYRLPGHPEAYLLTKEEIFAKIEEMLSLGGRTVLMQGGMHPGLGLDYYLDLYASIKERYPSVTLHSLSPPEVAYLARQEGLSFREVLERLKAAGLGSLPGGGAEILVDRVRRLLSPAKATTSEWLEVMRTAHSLGMPATATMTFGGIETLEERVEHLLRIRELQDETGGFTAFIPWSFQKRNTRLEGEEVSGLEYLKVLAISRLFLDNIPNIQASWLTQGLKLGQVALSFGANDLGGTMIEENVVRAAGVTHRSSPKQMIRLIRDVGKKPALRDSRYNILEVY